MKKSILIIVVVSAFAFSAFSQKLVTTKSQLKIFSHTVAEDIQASNTKAVGTVTTETGEVVFSIPMQSFEFAKALMQKHYNSPKFLDTKQFPKAKLIGKITNLSSVNFKKDGTYTANVSGTLELHGVTKPVKEKAIVTVKGGVVSVTSKINIVLADYKIAFEKGKPSTNIAKTIEVGVDATF
ncbi:MAG: YceI family protein [Flavobacteriales bacterium CG_4_10_14_0_2_um_filter_32_8]|nr:MAG: YceI family protein [Flavobacteriales bacterium CG_4_10_14_0_2_um_filter_32_8]